MTDPFLSLHARALARTDDLVRTVSAADLDRPTPCADWTLAQLLAHMVGQNNGFAAAAMGETEDRTVWADKPVRHDAGGVYGTSVKRVVGAFNEPGALDHPWLIPPIREDRPFPGRAAAGFHLLDYVVHGWDVAAAMGVPSGFDAEVLAAVLPLAEEVPDGADRQRPGALFRPALPPGDGEALEAILRMLGRDPGWRP
ncbi:TIGR03086 family metal-binding protein [Actinorhabdospora filicis]|nr:TIGR03086 family metal-binding protein [Actinorhabdospora filicis]